MTSGDLREELIRVCLNARHPEARSVLANAGVPLDCGQAWGFDYVETIGSHHYQPDPAGAPAVIVPHFDGRKLVDLVAVGLRSRSCRTLRGVCTVLGSDHLDRARWGDQPARFYADPIAWFANGRDGAVVVDWRAARIQLADLPGIACDDEATARRIDDALRVPVDLPPIFVREACHAA